MEIWAWQQAWNAPRLMEVPEIYVAAYAETEANSEVILFFADLVMADI